MTFLDHEARIIEAQPYKLRTRRAYTRAVTRWLQRSGYQTTPATYDAAGNCHRCGEAGRCPGVHIQEEPQP